ncbi:MAG: ABC transporter ATP-binding protein/permease [Lachnospiraceae bacterium]|nr:ABC transporter ATP-binding protein/permease [Lachnospiraceae bacterium]MDE7239169.1 ABC transporter ATP-binding protein/permease [Lachnospiraceae bacterium]
MKRSTHIIFNYLKGHLKLYVSSLIVSFLVIVVSYSLPYIQAMIIDNGILGLNKRILIYGMVVYFGMYFVQYGLNYINQRVTLKLEQNINTRLTMDIVEYYLHSKEYEFHEQIGSDVETLISRDINFFVTFMMNVVQETLINIISFFMAIVVLIQIRVEFAVIIIAVQILSLILRRFFNGIIKKNNKTTHKLAVKYNAILNEYANNIRNLKFLGVNGFINRRIENIKEKSNAQAIINMKTRYRLNGMLLFLSQLTSYTIMVIGGLFVISGNISLGFLMSSLQYSDRCESALKSIMSLSTEIASNRIEYQRIFEIILKKAENKKVQDTIGWMESIEVISVRDLNFSYNSYHEIFKNVNVVFRKGILYYMIGESGVGKTTLAKLLMGEYKIEDGTIFFDGTDINKCRIEQLQQIITWVPNETIIWNDGIKENILCGRHVDMEKYNQVCKDCEIDDIESELSTHHINLGEKGSLVSAGQKQRIGLARALISAKPIVIIDEITANLDQQTELMIKNNIGKYMYDKIIIIITHSKEFIRDDAVVYEIKDKSICEMG